MKSITARHRYPVVLALSLALIAPSVSVSAQPQRTPDGKTLVAPAAHASKGTIYYLVPGKPGPNSDQTRFTNYPPEGKKVKPIDAFTGFSNGAIGYIVASPDNPQSVVAGEFLLPVESLDTGVKLRNKHLAGSDWLDSDKHPDIHVSLAGIRDLTRDESQEDPNTYKGEIFGSMTISGVQRDFSFPATIRLLPESERTRSIARGDLLAIETQYDVKLSDFQINNKVIGQRVADTIVVEQFLIFSTNKPS